MWKNEELLTNWLACVEQAPRRKSLNALLFSPLAGLWWWAGVCAEIDALGPTSGWPFATTNAGPRATGRPADGRRRHGVIPNELRLPPYESTGMSFGPGTFVPNTRPCRSNSPSNGCLRNS